MGNGNSTNKKDAESIAKSYGVKPEQVKVISGKIFLKQSRQDVKLSSSVLKAFKNSNNFSKDYDEE